MGRGDATRAAAAACGPGRIVTTAQLRAAGISRRLAEREVSAARWQRGARGIYLPRPGPPVAADLVEASAAHVGGPFLVTGCLVLAELGLRWLPPLDGVHVLVPDGVRTTSSHRVRVTRTTDFDRLQTWIRYDAPLAHAARAIVDAARFARSLREARGIVLGGVADGWAVPSDLRGILDAGQRNGSGIARRAILDAERGCASPPEAELVDALVGRGVPFLVNPQLWADGVLLGSPDVWLVRTAVGGEVDSAERHEGEHQVESTYDRHERYAVAGIDLAHLSVRRIRRDAAEAAGHLLRRAAAGPSAPRGLVVVPRGPVLR